MNRIICFCVIGIVIAKRNNIFYPIKFVKFNQFSPLNKNNIVWLLYNGIGVCEVSRRGIWANVSLQQTLY